MTQLYYKNSQINNFEKITYKDIGAASLNHTHTINDLLNSSILDVSNGGANIHNVSQTTAGIYAAKEDYLGLQTIPISSGVFGYFNGASNYPNFQIWPTIAGGTGCTNKIDVAKKFNICKTNEQDDYIYDLNYKDIVDAFITNSSTKIFFSLYLPFQLLEKTKCNISLYPLIIQQPKTNAAYYQSTYLCGFENAEFIVDQETIIADNIYYYGHDNNDGGIAGKIANATPVGNTTIRSTGMKLFTNNNQLCYQVGHIINIIMDFKTDIPLTVANTKFTNNSPIILILNKGTGVVTNQLIIPALQNTSPSQEDDEDEVIEENE